MKNPVVEDVATVEPMNPTEQLRLFDVRAIPLVVIDQTSYVTEGGKVQNVWRYMYDPNHERNWQPSRA